MLIESQGKGVELIMKSIPYSNQITNIDLSHEKAIYFTWRSGNYKFDLHSCRVETVDGVLLVGDDKAILMTQLLTNNLHKLT